MSPVISAAVRAALPVARHALESSDAAYGVPDAIVVQLDTAGLLQSPETAAELTSYRSLALGSVDGRVSASCPDPSHPSWLRTLDDQRTCPWCYAAELEGLGIANRARIAALEADRSVDLPRLRADISAWSKRCRGAESGLRALRVQLAEAQAVVAAGPTTVWWLADYEGAENGPSLHATADSAKEWCAEWSTGDPYWDWVEQDGVWEQWACDTDTDRPVSRGPGTATPTTVQGVTASVDDLAERLTGANLALFEEEQDTARLRLALKSARRGRAAARERVAKLEAADLTAFRASYPESGIVLDEYRTRQAAMDHVHHILANEESTTPAAIELRVIWREDGPTGPEDEPTAWECWLFDADSDHDAPTGYVVSPITVATAYDPEMDA